MHEQRSTKRKTANRPVVEVPTHGAVRATRAQRAAEGPELSESLGFIQVLLPFLLRRLRSKQSRSCWMPMHWMPLAADHNLTSKSVKFRKIARFQAFAEEARRKLAVAPVLNMSLSSLAACSRTVAFQAKEINDRAKDACQEVFLSLLSELSFLHCLCWQPSRLIALSLRHFVTCRQKFGCAPDGIRTHISLA